MLLFCPELNRKGNPAQEKCSRVKDRVNQPDWWHSPLSEREWNESLCCEVKHVKMKREDSRTAQLFST